MTDQNGLSDAILLRLSDRIHTLEQQTATHAAEIAGLNENVADVRNNVAALSQEIDDVRSASTEAARTFEQMRKPLQGLLDLRQRFTGAWLVVTALLMVAAYLFQPLLADLYHWHRGAGSPFIP